MTFQPVLPKPRLLVLAALAALTPTAIVSAQPERAPEAMPWLHAGPLQTIADSSGRTDPAVRGVWQSRGYGWILSIDEDGVTRYQDGVQCYSLPRQDGGQSAMDSIEYRYFRPLPGGDEAIFQLLDGDTNVVFERLDELPSHCTRSPEAGPQAVAAEFLDAFEEHYAFFDRRPPGHAQRAARLRGSISADMSDADLWAALASYMEGLSDSHTKLIGTVDGERKRVRSGSEKAPGRTREPVS